MQLRRHYFDHCAVHSRLFPGVRRCLEALRDIPLAVATLLRTAFADSSREAAE